jgi:hypothetical protein
MGPGSYTLGSYPLFWGKLQRPPRHSEEILDCFLDGPFWGLYMYVSCFTCIIKLPGEVVPTCHLQVGKLGQRCSPDYVTMSQQKISALQPGQSGLNISCHQLTIVLLHPVTTPYHPNRERWHPQRNNCAIFQN